MRSVLAFLALIALLVFGMGLVQHSAQTAGVINASANGLVKLFGLELGTVPKGH